MLWIWLSLCCIGSMAHAATTPVVVGPQFSSEALDGHLELLRDPTGRLTLNDILTGPAAAGFTPIPGTLALGYITDVVWLRIMIATSTDTPPNLFLDMRPTFLDDVRVFSSTAASPRAASDFSEVRLGDHVPLSQRPAIAIGLIAKIDYTPHAESMVYLRIQTSSTTALRGSVRAGGSIITAATIDGIQYGVFQGILVLMTFAHLFYWTRLRDKTYLFYGFLLAVQSILFWCNNGVVPPEMLPGNGVGIDHLNMAAVCLSHTFATLFVSAQVDARRRFPWMYRVLMTIALLTLAATIASLAGYYKSVVGPVLASGVLIFAIALFCNLRLALRGVPGSWLASFACASQVTGIFVTAARLVGLLPYSIWTDNAFERGSMIFTIYMTMALAQRARTAEDERLIAQRQAVEVAQSAEQTAQALVERRTRELAAAKDLAEAALKAEHDAQQEQLRFIDVISHQYRTPLSVVSSSVSAIKQSLAPGDDANLPRVERIKKAIARLVDIIDVNLHRSRIDGATAHPDIRSLAIGPLIREIVAQTQEISDSRTFAIQFEGDAESATIAADPEMLGLALLNLIENAQKFSPADQPIDILCRRDGASLRLSVRDYGIGIPAQERDHLAKKYYRASNSGQTIGMGLGLHIVQSIAHTNGGHLTIESEEYVGTCMTLTFATLPEERNALDATSSRPLHLDGASADA